MKTVNCWDCKHLQTSVYMQLEDETLYNCWCNTGDVDNKECDKFEFKNER